MAASRSGDPTNPFSLGSNSADEESSADEDQPPVITVHNLTARFFFNRPAEELVPAQYLQMAERTCESLTPPRSYTSMNERKPSEN